MVSSSRIITVSYGTFSCTVEGFEDSLAVLKDTTHFIHGVVAKDRYFGAEPPQYDPETIEALQQQQILAEQTDQGLTLRPALGAGAASAGALTAALAAGPARTAPPAVEIPDDDTIEAAAQEVEKVEAAPEAGAEDAVSALVANAEGDAPEADAESGAEEAVSTLEAETVEVDEEVVAEVEADTQDDAEDAVSALVAEDAGDSEEATAEPAADMQADAEDAVFALVAEDAGVDEEAKAESEAETQDDAEEAVTALVAEEVDAETSADAPEGEIADVPSFDLDDLLQDADDEPAQAEDVPAPVAPPSSSDIAAKLQRIRAVVGQTDGEDSDDFVEDTIVGTDDSFDSAALSELLGSMESEDDDDDALAALVDAEVAESDAVAEADAEPEVADDTSEPEVAEASSEDADDALWAELGISDDTTAEDDAEATEWTSLSADDLGEGDAEAEPATADTEDDVTAEADAPAEPAKPRLRARVVKVKRAEFEAAVATGKLEEVEDDEDDPVAEDTGSSLSRNEEEELARELAAIKAELSDDEDDWEDADEDDTAEAAPEPLRLDNPVNRPTRSWDSDLDDDLDELDAKAARASAALHGEDSDAISEAVAESARENARKLVKMASPARAMLTETSVEDNDTSRILDETNSQLEEPEGNRRRSAIAHLRAAVAATKADRLLGRKSDDDDETDPYREDLATVVRPRRPQAGSGRTERPAEPAPRPAPLQLVAEQRIGEDADPADIPAPASVVRPRRISSADIPEKPATLRDPEAEATGFAAYAEEMGAHNLPDLLEAAAAYMSFVEGMDQFSRPQLMTTVRQAEIEETSREDRLRSFGQLLREGKIEKTRGGRFTASDRINFKPDALAG